MKKTNSIRSFFIVTMVLLLCFLVYLFYSMNRPSGDSQTPSTEQEQISETEEILQKTSNIPSDAIFILKDCDGYLTVYLIAEDTVYMYTDITMDSLPQSLQEEIDTGKTFSNAEELFRFLESYSS
ncbi:MAG: hypothetical protein ACI4DO_02185 [Roseburia sp.]